MGKSTATPARSRTKKTTAIAKPAAGAKNLRTPASTTAGKTAHGTAGTKPPIGGTGNKTGGSKSTAMGTKPRTKTAA